MSKHHKLNGKNYRKIWESANGKIPTGHHIHHADGNPYNNDISNLICVSAEEHSIIHNDEITKWASIGGKIGGDKCREEKLGFFSASKEQRKEWGLYASSCVNREFMGERIKEEYKLGIRKHWTEYYSEVEISSKISSGDPGKSRRGKEAWNKGKKMNLTNPELAIENKKKAAINRLKYKCDCCSLEFDAGNLKKHQNAKAKRK